MTHTPTAALAANPALMPELRQAAALGDAECIILLLARDSTGYTLRDLQESIAALSLDAHVWRSTSRGFRVGIAGLAGGWVEVSTLSQAAALAAMRLPKPAPAAAPSPLQRLAQWAKGLDLQELRWDAVNALLNVGLPALSLVPVARLPRLIGGAEYALKTPWVEAPLAVLAAAEDDARRWLD